MSNEFLMEVFFIKIKVKGYLENISENTKENIDTSGIINKNKLSYLNNGTKHNLTINNDKIILLRDNQEFMHNITFMFNKKTTTEYYIKEYGVSLNIDILTTNIIKNENKIIIEYKIVDTNTEYRYIIEMSE